MQTEFFKEDMPFKTSDTTITDASVFSKPTITGGIFYE